MPLDLNVRPIVDGKYIIPKTVDYIKAKRRGPKNRSLFTWVIPSGTPPAIPNPNFAGKSTQRGGPFADIIGEMDYRVGQILDAIKEAGIEDNTIVVLSSDNGSDGVIPQFGGNTNGPWRGDFMNTPFEGSIRVPAMIRWPGKVPAGVVSNEMVAAVDWLPTVVDLIDGLIRLEDSKNGDPRTVVMTDKMRGLMLELVRGKGDQDYVFTREDGTRVVDHRQDWYDLCVAVKLMFLRSGTTARPTTSTSGSIRTISGECASKHAQA